MKKTLWLVLALAPLALITGCTDKFKEPAEAAIKAGDGAVEALRSEEVVQYAPGPAKAVTDALAGAKAKAAAKEYEAALGLAKDVPARVKDVVGQASQAAQAAAEAKKKAVETAWEEASRDASASLASVHERLAALKKAKTLPKGFDKKKLAAASTKAASLEGDWTKASEKAKAGAVEEATAMAKDVAVRCKELAASLPAVKAPAPAPAKAKAPAKKK